MKHKNKKVVCLCDPHEINYNCCVHHFPNKPLSKNKKWQEEFDKEFINSYGHWDSKNIYRDGGVTHIKVIKSFISKLLSKQKAESWKEGYEEATKDTKGFDSAQKEMVRENIKSELLKSILEKLPKEWKFPEHKCPSLTNNCVCIWNE